MERGQEGNGKLSPCWLSNDCQLAKDQRDGNKILRDILAEAKTLRHTLVGPATGRRQVSSNIFIWTVLTLGALILVLIIKDSTKDFHATGLGASLHVEQQKKTADHESE